jgi:hypothetical protein
MRSIEARFKQIEKEQPYLSSLMCLCGAVKGQGFSYETIRKAFDRLVDKDDYQPKQREILLRHLENLAGKSLVVRAWQSNLPRKEKQGCEVRVAK